MNSHIAIREKFRMFFTSKKHAWIPSSSLLPTDPSVLFTTAGMQQFKPYYIGELDPINDFGSLNTASIQKSLRTSDIDDVGDESHLTFFEMLGNFSFGGYWKDQAIRLSYDFITNEMGMTIDYVTVFGGEDDIPADTESEKIWSQMDPDLKIIKKAKADNFWGPTGIEGPCGPTTEIYVIGLEIWNIVFNEYYKNAAGEFSKLRLAGIDTGMGLERLLMVASGLSSIYATDLFSEIMAMFPSNIPERIKRIVADHCRAIVFLINDGVRPSNKEQGYVLRRLIRRTIVLSHTYNFPGDLKKEILRKFVTLYKEVYPELDSENIVSVFKDESGKFRETLHLGLRELDKLNSIDAKSAFHLYESYGLPFEIIKELGDNKAKALNREDFEVEFKKHQELSRVGAEKKFGGHGLILNTGEIKANSDHELAVVTRLHTATHLLHASLRKVLGNNVKQAGSDITPERLRFDFTFHRKLTPEEVKAVEDIANSAVNSDYAVTKQEMKFQDAIDSGALAFFRLKYPASVTVYSIGDFSKELCGGPHVDRTGLVGRITIIKEEAVSSGVRRIRATVE